MDKQINNDLVVIHSQIKKRFFVWNTPRIELEFGKKVLFFEKRAKP